MGRNGCYFIVHTGSRKQSTETARQKWMDWEGQIAEKGVALVTARNRKEREVRVHQVHNGRRSGQQVLGGKPKEKNKFKKKIAEF